MNPNLIPLLLDDPPIFKQRSLNWLFGGTLTSPEHFLAFIARFNRVIRGPSILRRSARRLLLLVKQI
jgi:hypothetical protein